MYPDVQTKRGIVGRWASGPRLGDKSIRMDRVSRNRVHSGEPAALNPLLLLSPLALNLECVNFEVEDEGKEWEGRQ